MKAAHFAVLAAVLGTVMTTIALMELIPEGKWLYLLLLVFGTHAVTMAFRGAANTD